MSFREFHREHVRLAVLQLLEQDAGYRHNEGVILSGLLYVGHTVTAAQVRTELSWLEEQGLVSTERVGDLVVAEVSERGCDVAAGRVRAPGVARVRPK